MGVAELKHVDVRYKCRCFAEERTVQVIARHPANVVTAWLNIVVRPALEADHRKRSPLCMAKTLEYTKLPIDEPTGLVGAAASEGKS